MGGLSITEGNHQSKSVQNLCSFSVEDDGECVCVCVCVLCSVSD